MTFQFSEGVSKLQEFHQDQPVSLFQIVFGGYFFLLDVIWELMRDKYKNTLVSTCDCIQQ